MRTTAIEYADASGFVGDADLHNSITSFFAYLMSGDDEERDTHLRKVNFHLNRVMKRPENDRFSFRWFSCKSRSTEISVEGLRAQYNLSDKEKEFFEAMYFKNLKIGAALAIVDSLISWLTFYDDNEL